MLFKIPVGTCLKTIIFTVLVMPVLQKWHSSRFSAWIYLFCSLSVWNYEHQEQFACVSGICVRLECLDWKVCVCVCKLGDVYPWTDTGNIQSHLTCKSLCKWGPWVRVCQGGGHVSASCVCGGHTEREDGWVCMRREGWDRDTHVELLWHCLPTLWVQWSTAFLQHYVLVSSQEFLLRDCLEEHFCLLSYAIFFLSNFSAFFFANVKIKRTEWCHLFMNCL